MATYSRNKKTGTWRAQLCVDQSRRSQAGFASKPEARAWAHKKEAELRSAKKDRIPDKTFGALLARYRDEVTPTKRGSRWEVTRLNAAIRDRELADVLLSDISTTHVARWRDRRLELVGSASVLREWNLLSSAANHARVEWKWLEVNPFSDVRRPQAPAHRDRIVTADELARLEMAVYAHPEKNFYPRVLRAAEFAIETGMRAGEIVGLLWRDIDVGLRVARLDHEITVNGRTVFATKNGKKRSVPLSERALLAANSGEVYSTGSVFGLTSEQLDSHWRALCADAGIEGLHFHDTRHTAITRLAEKLDVLELARMVGVTDLKILMVYYNKSAADIALKL